MGGLDLSIVFKPGHHEANTKCAYAKHDAIVEKLIQELYLLATSCDCYDSKTDPVDYAQELREKLPSLEACKMMQLFPNEWPTARLTDEEREELLDKNADVYEDDCEGNDCDACKMNMMCLANAGFITIQGLREGLEISLRTADETYFENETIKSVDAEVDKLIDRALYIQSRAHDLYYGGLLEQI